jgi:hypothetical protein
LKVRNVDCRLTNPANLTAIIETLSSIAKEIQVSKIKTNVYFDSVQTLLLLTSQQCVINVIQLFSDIKSASLIIPFHKELEIPTITQEIIPLESVLLQLCCCFVHLYESESKMFCNLLLKKITGKVIREETYFNIQGSAINFYLDTIDAEKTVEAKEVEFNVSMNVALTQQQRDQKDNLILPYLEAQRDTGLIQYQPDEHDDYDEEDPDEDLEI